MLKEPINKSVFKDIAKQAGVEVIDLVNTRSQVYKKLGLDVNNMSEAEAIQYMADNPRIMKRPIVTGGKSVLFAYKEAEYEANLLK